MMPGEVLAILFESKEKSLSNEWVAGRPVSHATTNGAWPEAARISRRLDTTEAESTTAESDYEISFQIISLRPFP